MEDARAGTLVLGGDHCTVDDQKAARRQPALFVLLEEAAIDGEDVLRPFEEVGSAVPRLLDLLDRAEMKTPPVEGEGVNREAESGYRDQAVIKAGDQRCRPCRLAAFEEQRQVRFRQRLRVGALGRLGGTGCHQERDRCREHEGGHPGACGAGKEHAFSPGIVRRSSWIPSPI